MDARIQRLLDRAFQRLRIAQKANRAAHVNQSVTVNVLLAQDGELARLTDSVVSESLASTLMFQAITDSLQKLEHRNLDPNQQELTSAWLRKVAAENHIRLARRHAVDRRFRLYMLDTSCVDQPYGAWTKIEDFIRVVQADGQIAQAQLRLNHPDAVLRVVFIPDAAFIVNGRDYLLKLIASQVSEYITLCISRHDLAKADDPALLGDGFCIADRFVCEIQKPSWQFTTSQSQPEINRFIARVHHLAGAFYSVVIRNGDLPRLNDILLSLVAL